MLPFYYGLDLDLNSDLGFCFWFWLALGIPIWDVGFSIGMFVHVIWVVWIVCWVCFLGWLISWCWFGFDCVFHPDSGSVSDFDLGLWVGFWFVISIWGVGFVWLGIRNLGFGIWRCALVSLLLVSGNCWLHRSRNARLTKQSVAVGGFGNELLHLTFLVDLSRSPRNPPFVFCFGFWILLWSGIPAFSLGLGLDMGWALGSGLGVRLWSALRRSGSTRSCGSSHRMCENKWHLWGSNPRPFGLAP